MFKPLRLLKVLVLTAFWSLVLAGVTSAEPLAASSGSRPLVALTCSTKWADAVKPSFNNIQNNTVGLFVFVATGLGLIAICAVVFLHWSRHRSTFLALLAAIVAAMIGIAIWPGFAASLLPVCGG